MKNWHPALQLLAFAAALVLVAGGMFVVGRTVGNAAKHQTVGKAK